MAHAQTPVRTFRLRGRKDGDGRQESACGHSASIKAALLCTASGIAFAVGAVIAVEALLALHAASRSPGGGPHPATAANVRLHL